MKINLRHLRLFAIVAESGSVTAAAAIMNMSQPAASQALQQLDHRFGVPLLERTRGGTRLSNSGTTLLARVKRAFGWLLPAFERAGFRPGFVPTHSQLLALTALADTESFSSAARRLGVSQPTVHRAISTLEDEASASFFVRLPVGVLPTRSATELARAAQLAFTELDQAATEIPGAVDGEIARITIGALPLSRSAILPPALAEFAQRWPCQRVLVLDGRYSELVRGLRHGAVDIVIGALRVSSPSPDLAQEVLFEDDLSFVASANHPLADSVDRSPAALRAYPWIVPRTGTPARDRLDAFFAETGLPESIVETGSFTLTRELLNQAPYLACISQSQCRSSLSDGTLVSLTNGPETSRPIGMTYRKAWQPTEIQSEMLTILRQTGRTVSLR